MYITEPTGILTRLLAFSNGSKRLFFIQKQLILAICRGQKWFQCIRQGTIAIAVIREFIQKTCRLVQQDVVLDFLACIKHMGFLICVIFPGECIYPTSFRRGPFHLADFLFYRVSICIKIPPFLADLIKGLKWRILAPHTHHTTGLLGLGVKNLLST